MGHPWGSVLALESQNTQAKENPQKGLGAQGVHQSVFDTR
jgi:hypothetical protein